ncbi:putative glutathione peroxidase 4 isoform X2 [Iris pallida]|uniref:Glutathione peroxidase n=1 Tax=Iris pallida TaxID=29817 RepID=A0AAX6FL58_IRIPA|nr:putative glutathione peroxidase 4 isoform X2 [Iris pallida]
MGNSRSSPMETSIHQFTVRDCAGGDVDLQRYKGKVLLVVNVANQCRLTNVNYTQMAELYAKYRNRDFEILAFPCNQFWKQSPGSSQEVKETHVQDSRQSIQSSKRLK